MTRAERAVRKIEERAEAFAMFAEGKTVFAVASRIHVWVRDAKKLRAEWLAERDAKVIP